MKLQVFGVALVVATLASTSSAQDFFLGKCPEQSVVQNFDLNSYLGKWYEIEKYFAIFELGGKCITAEYSLLPNGNIRVLNSQSNVVTGKQSSAEGEASVVNTSSGEGKLNVNFSPFGSFGGGDGNYWVLDTDYTTYAIVWSCSFDVGLFNSQFLWVLMRDQNPDPQRLHYVRNIIRTRGLDVDRLKRTEQSDCP